MPALQSSASIVEPRSAVPAQRCRQTCHHSLPYRCRRRGHWRHYRASSGAIKPPATCKAAWVVGLSVGAHAHLLCRRCRHRTGHRLHRRRRSRIPASHRGCHRSHRFFHPHRNLLCLPCHPHHPLHHRRPRHPPPLQSHRPRPRQPLATRLVPPRHHRYSCSQPRPPRPSLHRPQCLCHLPPRRPRPRVMPLREYRHHHHHHLQRHHHHRHLQRHHHHRHLQRHYHRPMHQKCRWCRRRRKHHR